MRLEDLALIGNCQISALVERNGAIVWCCLPRYDSEPVFGALLDEKHGGSFAVLPLGGGLGVQRYLENTNVLETRFETPDGGFRVLDFAPRFFLHDRAFRPTQLIRVLEPLSGIPRIRVCCDPVLGWSKAVPPVLRGSNHLAFEDFASPFRLTTDIPLSYLGGPAFALTERRHLALTWGAPIEEPLAPLCERFLRETTRYWQRWVKHCNIPPAYQREVIRSALILKLHCFEDTGAIVASMTTSIPEAPETGRTWDYRYCWLRDAYYSLGAFRLLGHFEEREHFIKYLLNIASNTPSFDLFPLYRVDGTSGPDERVLTHWPGFRGDGPVRTGNGAARRTQNDIFGEMVLALAPAFLDDRFSAERSPTTLGLLEALARKAIAVVGTPDPGICEYRMESKTQSFSSLMCWAAADRMALIASRHAPQMEVEFRASAVRIRAEIAERAWSTELGSFVGHYDGGDLDASLLQMPSLRFLHAHDVRLRATIDAVWERLSQDGWLFRHRHADSVGKPPVALVIWTFWLVEALSAIGELDAAKSVMKDVHAALSPLGLLAKDYETSSLRMWGNFPQAYSHVGLIHAAFAASPRWSDIL